LSPAKAAKKPAKPEKGQRKPASKAVEVEVEGRRLKLSNLDKVFYPQVGFTKGQVIDFYRRIAPALLPHLRDRPLTLKRYPDGVDGQFFYEKQCPSYRPDWIKTVTVQNKREIHYCLANDLSTLIWLTNLADLELHTSLSRAKDVMRPTMMVFDLDPGPPAAILECAQIGIELRDLFADLGLDCYPKTSGSKGLQIYVPLNTPVTYETTKPFAHAIAMHLEQKLPKLVVSSQKKSIRKGKILVDWSQNDDHKTTICVYSLRARERPTVSTPVTWDEVESAAKKKKAEALVFDSNAVLKRFEKRGDLFEPVLKQKQKLPKL
jgi:bifunctional non-homologous end joining protein LigD